MPALYDVTRHEPLPVAEWSESHARGAIAAICRDAESAFHTDRLWPMHPEDEEPNTPTDMVFRWLCLGASGMVHGLDRLARAGFYEPSLDFAAIARGFHEAFLVSPNYEGEGGSFMFGA